MPSLRLIVLLLAAPWVLSSHGGDATGVQATVESSLTTAAPQIRMLAFDGDANSYYASSNNAGPGDHVTLRFDKAVSVKKIAVSTGRVKGGDALDKGALEISEDGKTFKHLAEFADGNVSADAGGKMIKAVRLVPGAELNHPLAVREFTLDADPPVAVFKYPMENILDYKDAPDMKEWLERSAVINERAYQMICEELKSDGFTPRTVVPLTLKNDYKGVAVTYNSARVVGATAYFKAHDRDYGAMVHEMVHVVQSYKGRNNPGWLVEGIADYIRCYKYEGGKVRPLPPTAKYDGSYQITAIFLKYLVDKYDPLIVNKLNHAMREGKYNESIFEELTKKKLPELGDEWKASLKK